MREHGFLEVCSVEIGAVQCLVLEVEPLQASVLQSHPGKVRRADRDLHRLALRRRLALLIVLMRAEVEQKLDDEDGEGD